MDDALGLKCLLVGAEYSPDEAVHVCPKHGADSISDVVYDYGAVSHQGWGHAHGARGQRRRNLTLQTVVAHPA